MAGKNTDDTMPNKRNSKPGFPVRGPHATQCIGVTLASEQIDNREL